jgi:hypothetical protein
MSLEMAHKVIVPQKKIRSQSFLNSGTLIVNMADCSCSLSLLGHTQSVNWRKQTQP